jgi:polysaccharide biosynthesis protein PslH
VVSSDAADADALAMTRLEFEVLPPVLPQLSRSRTVAQKLRRWLDARYMNLHGYAASVADQQRVESSAKNFDLIWILNSRTPNILSRWKWVGAHLDIDDVPSTYLRTVSESSSQRTQRLKARVQQTLLLRREKLLLERFTTVSVCSAPDKSYLGDDERIHVIPNGFERPASAPLRNVQQSAPRIGFIGLYSYVPNVEGVRWFLKNCWPTVRNAIPGVRLRLVGKDTDGPLKPTDPGVDSLGWVSDPSAEIATWSCMIIPIRMGGGTRIKIAEAFSRKCPVVSTSLGAFGYEVTNGEHLLIADKAEDFSHACIDLVRDVERAAKIAERAWLEFLQRWTWDAVAPKIWHAAEDCLRRSHASNK